MEGGKGGEREKKKKNSHNKQHLGGREKGGWEEMYRHPCPGDTHYTHAPS